MALADVIHRIATDKDFAAQLRAEPWVALKAAGLDLPDEALAALLKVLHQAADLSDTPTELPLYNWTLFQFPHQWSSYSTSVSG